MPHVSVKTRYGTVNFHYTISTPNCSSAKSIDPCLPVILWLHASYVSGILFHPQLNDPELRKYNNVTVDFRLHGETTSTQDVDTWSLDEAAEDIVNFMDTLGLPPCHVIGVSSGASIGLSIAQLYPKHAVSLLLMSPLSLVEPPEVAEGRRQVADIWLEGMRNNDEGALLDAAHGALQFSVSNQPSRITDCIVAYDFPYALKHYSASNESQYRLLTCEYIVNRQPPTRNSLARIRAPIRIVHFGNDIAYKLEQTMELRDALLCAGCTVKMMELPEACHYGSLTHPQETNRVIGDHMRSSVPNANELPFPIQPTSPFEKEMVRNGLYDVDSSSESEDD